MSQHSDIDKIIGVDNRVSDTSIVTGLWISTIIGGAVLILFCILQRSSSLYRYRLVARHVRVPPRKLQPHGVISLVDWAIKAMTVSDVEFLLSAGLDALLMVKLCALGVQLFLPLCLVGVTVLIPLHWTGGESEVTKAYHSNFMRLTMSNIVKGSSRFWVHLACVYLYMGWAMWLLSWHYHEYLTMRQTYMQKGDDENTWRQLYGSSAMPEPAPDEGGDGNAMQRFLNNIRVIKEVLLPTAVATGPDTPHDVIAANEAEEEAEDVGRAAQAEERTSPARHSRPASFVAAAGSPRPAIDPLRKLPPPMYLTRQGSRRLSVIDKSVFLPEGSRSARTRFSDAATVSAQEHRVYHNPAAVSGGSATRSSPGVYVEEGGVNGDATLLRRSGPAHQGPDEAELHAHHVHGNAHHAHSHGHGHGHRLSPAHHLPPLTEEQAVTDAAPDGAYLAAAPHGGVIASGGRPIAEGTEDPAGAAAAPPASESGSVTGRQPSISASEVRLSMDGVDANGRPIAVEDVDVEVGLGSALVTRRSGGSSSSSGTTNNGVAPTANGPMRRCTSLAGDALDMEWWRGHGLRPKLRRGSAADAAGAADAADAGAPDGSANAGEDENGHFDEDAEIRKFRPSVSLRKTVNTVTRAGGRVAVFAQHYAVLVTDVVERGGAGSGTKPDSRVGSMVGSAIAKDAEARKSMASTRPRSLCPHWLHSWCKLGYGTFAARELYVSRRHSSESLDGHAFGSSRHTDTVAGSRASHGSELTPRSTRDATSPLGYSGTSMPRPAAQGPGAHSGPGHRRTQSAGAAPHAVGAGAGPGGQGTPRQLSQQRLHFHSGSSGQVGGAVASASDGAAASPGNGAADGAAGGASGGAGDKGAALVTAGSVNAGTLRTLPSIVENGSAASSPGTPRNVTTPPRGPGATAGASLASPSMPTNRLSRPGSAGGANDSRHRKPAIGFLQVLEAMAEQARAAAAVTQQRLHHQRSNSLQDTASAPGNVQAATAADRLGARAPSMPVSLHKTQQSSQQQQQPSSSRFAPAGGTRPRAVSQAGNSDVPRPAELTSGAGAAGEGEATDRRVSVNGSGGAVRQAAGPLGEATERDTNQDGGLADGNEIAQHEVDATDGGAGSKTAEVAPLSASITGPGDDPQHLINGTSLRRRRGAAAAVGGSADAGADDGDGRASGGAASAAGSGTVDAAALARARWAWLSELVFSGEVARLPRRKGYSVVSAAFSRMFPEEFDRAVPVVNHREVDLLLMQVDQHMAQYEYAREYEERTKQPLLGRTGWCGLLGERVRLRDFHRQKVEELIEQVHDARRRAFDEGHTPSWFVYFKTQRAATVAAQCVLHAEDNRQFKVHPAPGPDEVNWPTLWSDYRSRDWRRNLLRPLVLLVVMFPIGTFTGGLMQLDYLLCPDHKCLNQEEGSEEWIAFNCTTSDVNREIHQVSWDWYCEQESPVARLLQRLVVGWLPSLLINLWQGMVLPLLFMFVVQVGRQARSLSEADRYVASYMFLFAVFNVFLGGVVGSTIIQGINSAITNGPSEIFNLVGTYLPTSSNFFINYTMFRALVAVPLRMLWPHIGIRMYLLRRYLRFSCIITERDRACLMAPVSPRYGFEVGMVLLIFVIAFAFSVVSPILLPMALLFFGLAWLFWRWALLYVYVRKYEGGGTMWPFIFSRVLVCMGIFPFFTACVFVTKHAYIQAILLFVTVPVIIIRFQAHCYYRYQVGVKAMPLEAAVAAPRASIDPWVYFPPPLLTSLAGWNPEWAKVWQGWNLPVMYA